MTSRTRPVWRRTAASAWRRDCPWPRRAPAARRRPPRRRGGSQEDPAMAEQDIKQIVKEKYGKAALQVVAGAQASCCSTTAGCGGDAAADPITSNLYSDSETAALPAAAVAASLGCGNP